MNIQVRGILFDMDGVLVSSLGSVERSWTRWAERHGVDPAVAIRTAHGRRAIESVRLLRPDLNDEQELKWLEDMEVEDNEGLEILKGVQPILEAIPEKHWTVVTSATERLARARMADGGIPVPARIVTADMVTRGKPDPEPYRRGAELLGLRPEECLVVEDAPSGVGAGLAAGCRVLGVVGTHSAAELAGAQWIVGSLEGVAVTVGGAGLEVRFAPMV